MKNYIYEYWNGKEVVGKYCSEYPLLGKFLIVPFLNKNNSIKEIKVPVLYKVVLDDGVNIKMRRYLDIRKKSKKQMGLLFSLNK